MAKEQGRLGWFAELMYPERRLFSRVVAVLRLDPAVYGEIAGDPGAIPQAFAVVIATSVVVGIGQFSLAGLFIGMAWTIALWLLIAGLFWSAGAVLVGERSHYAPLLRCLGFAYAWFALFIGFELPLVGSLFGVAAVALCLWSSVLAVRKVLELSTERALMVCGAALGLPLFLLWVVFR